MTKWQKKKIRDVILVTVMLILGITITFCNMFKITPGYDDQISCLITDIIAYGFLIGNIIIVMSVASLNEIINTDYKLKKLQKKIRK